MVTFADYLGVVVSGILSKSQHLCKLNVRVGLSKFQWSEETLLDNIKTLVGPFERLRNVRQPRLCAVYGGTPTTNFMMSLPLPSHIGNSGASGPNQPQQNPMRTPLCSIPRLPATHVLLCPGEHTGFDAYRSRWESWISSNSASSLVREPPIRAMFTVFKEYYTNLSAVVPDVMSQQGRHAFLHRARVAREQEDVEAFRKLCNELVGYWYAYLQQEERKKEDMDKRMSKMLDADVYPTSFELDADVYPASFEDEFIERGASGSSSSGSNAHSPVLLDVGAMSKEGIPMQGNPVNEVQRRQMHQQAMQRQLRHSYQQPIGGSMRLPLASANPQQQLQNGQTMALNPRLSNPQQRAHQVVQHLPPHVRPPMLQRIAHAQQAAQANRAQSGVLSAFSPTVAQPQSSTLPTMPTQQQGSEFMKVVHSDSFSQPVDGTSPSSSKASSPVETKSHIDPDTELSRYTHGLDHEEDLSNGIERTWGPNDLAPEVPVALPYSEPEAEGSQDFSKSRANSAMGRMHVEEVEENNYGYAFDNRDFAEWTTTHRI